MHCALNIEFFGFQTDTSNITIFSITEQKMAKATKKNKPYCKIKYEYSISRGAHLIYSIFQTEKEDGQCQGSIFLQHQILQLYILQHYTNVYKHALNLESSIIACNVRQ